MKPLVQTAWTAQAILDFLSAHAIELKAMGVTSIGLFGSYVRGEQKPESDIDFLFTMDDLTWRRWMNVWNYLEDELGMKIDLVPRDQLRPELHSMCFQRCNMPRAIDLYMYDIVQAIRSISKYTDGLDKKAFLADEMRQHSTLYNLVVIGEAVKNLPDEIQAKVADVPWRDIERFRDKLVHHYFSIDPETVWEIVQEDLPLLKIAVKTLLDNIKVDDDTEDDN